MSEKRSHGKKGTTRRNLLAQVIAFLSFGVFLGFINVVVRYLIPPARAKKMEKLAIDIAQVPRGSSLKINFGDEPVILINLKEGIRAFSAVCTHLGCIVKWNNEKNVFVCPCHGGIFDPSGRVIAGPPPEPLRRINIKIKKDQIIIV